MTKFKEKTEKIFSPLILKIIMIAIPFLSIILLETGLNIFDYGKNYSTFIPTRENSNFLKLNPELTFKYFPGLKLPMNLIPDAFTTIKNENTFRIFVFGGSTTAGWPYSGNEAFPRRIRHQLETLYPQKNIEVINFGISAVNSYTILDIFEDAVEYKPDLILIYAGHNEYYGTLGVASASNLGQYPFIVNLILELKEFRTYQLLENILTIFSTSAPSGGTSNATIMERMIGDKSIELDGEIYKKGIEQFRTNLTKIAELAKANDIPLILGKLTSNLKHRPFVSDDNLNLKAMDSFESGINSLNENKIRLAKQSLVNAKELDNIRFRAPKGINDVIKEIANKFGVRLSDIDSVFASVSPNEIPGENIFVDHLHPTIEGHNLIGDVFTQEILRSGKLKNTGIKLSNDNKVLEKYPHSSLDLANSDLTLRVLLGSYPFVKKGEPNTLIKEFPRDNKPNEIAYQIYEMKVTPLQGYKLIQDYNLSVGEMKNYTDEVLAFLDHRPYFEEFYYQAIKNLSNYPSMQIKVIEKLHRHFPNNFTNHQIGRNYFEDDKYLLAKSYFETAIKIDPLDMSSRVYLAGIMLVNGEDWQKLIPKDNSKFYDATGKLSEYYVQSKKINEAEIFLNMRYRIEPDHYSTKWLGMLLVKKKKYVPARMFLIESLKFNNTEPSVYFNLSIVFWNLGDKNEARMAINKCLEINPDLEIAKKWKRDKRL